MTEKKQHGWFYPDVDTVASATHAARQGMVAALVAGIVTAVFAALAVRNVPEFPALGVDLYSFLDAALFLGAAFGIYRGSRAAAVFGLSLFILEKIFMWVDVGKAPGGLAMVLAVAFVNGVRGTYALHRLSRPPAGTYEPIEPK